MSSIKIQNTFKSVPEVIGWSYSERRFVTQADIVSGITDPSIVFFDAFASTANIASAINTPSISEGGGPAWQDFIGTGSGPAETSNSHWKQEFDGIGHGLWDGSEWYSVDYSFTRRVSLLAPYPENPGGWNNIQPTKIRLGINGAPFSPSGNMTVYLKVGPPPFGTHTLTMLYEDLDEIDIDPQWYIDDGPYIRGVSVLQSAARGDWQITSIEFLV